ncbi:hypothetical protein BOX15_Mlig031623g1 [Macrostomum lignano]|uniref:Uncharacterized protein n=1 Tax=Macrostomum lignano TaxID=282301 RepID=A0A267EZ15_9PLAT|nr:hypothetical protein BOX15_Mlig031623g1 [Macrostomum lignano]
MGQTLISERLRHSVETIRSAADNSDNEQSDPMGGGLRCYSTALQPGSDYFASWYAAATRCRQEHPSGNLTKCSDVLRQLDRRQGDALAEREAWLALLENWPAGLVEADVSAVQQR